MTLHSFKEDSILLLSCYELGHQPINLAWPAATLAKAGYSAQTVDLSVEVFPDKSASNAEVVAISVPMHTALRLGVQAAERIRTLNPEAHICFYGLYAWLNSDYLLDRFADSVIAGEAEQPLLQLVQALEQADTIINIPGVSTQTQPTNLHLMRPTLPIPDRSQLPDLDTYAHYTSDGVHTLAGYVEASRGCLHTCTHCPIVPIYQGRFFVIPVDTVMADVRQQVKAGAGHISFGDPDFLNGPGHAIKIARLLQAEFPQVTFDFTVKVEHILKHQSLFSEFAQLGCTFVTSAFEATQNHILERLEKGHTLADMDRALDILAEAGIAVQPTWMPFTPWTSLDDYLHLLEWILTRNLIQSVSAVQLSIRMLVPPSSALLDHADVETWCGPLDAANFGYSWVHPDPVMDELQIRIAELAESQSDADPYLAFSAIEALVHQTAGLSLPIYTIPAEAIPAPPQLSESWYC